MRSTLQLIFEPSLAAYQPALFFVSSYRVSLQWGVNGGERQEGIDEILEGSDQQFLTLDTELLD